MKFGKKEMVFGILTLVVLGFTFFQINSFVSAQSSNSVVCAVHSSEGICQDVPLSEVTPGSATYPTSCTSGPGLCVSGTCVSSAGVCNPSTRAACDPSLGGVFYYTSPRNTNICNQGCCVIEGQGGEITTRANCNTIEGYYPGATSGFYPSVTDTLTCSAMAAPNAIGACVISTSTGKTCEFTTQGNCLNITQDTNAFHENWLCTNQNLRNDGVNCTMTRETSCMTGQNKAIGTVDQVYFVDSCGNPANVYDLSKINDPNYWNYVAGTNGVTIESVATPGSTSNGNCDFYSGSICATYNSAIDGASSPVGGHLCRDINCNSGPFVQSFYNTYNRDPANGETWCARTDPSNPSQMILGNNTGLTNAAGTGPATVSSSLAKNQDLPGSGDYLLGCYDGKVTVEPCASYRNQICSQGENSNGVFQSSCVLNNFRSCYAQNNSKDCLAAGDCEWVIGVTNAKYVNSKTGKAYVYNATTKSLVPMVDQKGALGPLGISHSQPDGVDDLLRPGAACVPKYTPGLDVSTNASQSDQQSAVGLCNIGSAVCIVNYTRGAGSSLVNGSWKVDAKDNGVNPVITCLYNNGTINPNWMTNFSNMCFSIADCGVSANYLNGSGLNTLSDLAKVYGNLSEIPNSTSS